MRLRERSFGPEQRLVMAIIDRAPGTSYDRGASWAEAAAMERVDTVVGQGADIADMGGGPAGPSAEITVAEELRRTAPFVAAVRAAYPDLVISVDAYRHQTARELCAAGADLINDTREGWDERLPEVAASCGAGLVCRTLALAERAVARGVDPSRVLIGPVHDSGQNTRHRREATRRLGEMAEMAETGWAVLVSASHDDTLDAGHEEQLTGTLATTAVCAWLGVRVFRAHHVSQVRQVLDMVSAIRGDRPPARAVRGLA